MDMQTHRPPYRNPHYGKRPKEGHAWCERCHAVRQSRRWTYDDALYHQYTLTGGSDVVKMLCPGCQALDDKHYEGEVRILAEWTANHWETFEAWLKKLEAEELRKNPLGRIGSMELQPDGLHVCTTTGFLARKLGRSTHNAHHGRLEMHLPAGEPMTRVVWAEK